MYLCTKKYYERIWTRGPVGWACVALLSFCFDETIYRTFHRCFPPNFSSFGKGVSERMFRNRPIWKKNCLWRPCLIMDQNEMSNLYRRHSIYASYQVSYHLVKRLQRKRCFRNWPFRNNNCLWLPCLLTDQNRMSNSYRGPSIDASYYVSVHSNKLFQSSTFLEIDQSEKKNCLWWPFLLMDPGEMSSLYWGTPIDASYQVLVHLRKRFQRSRFYF